MASLIDYYRFVVEKWYGGSSRKFIEYAASAVERRFHDKNIFILEAPTGYGKSSFSAAFSLFSVYEEFKSIVAYPLRVLLEDQYYRFIKVFPEDFVGRRYMSTTESPYLIYPVTLTTIDTLSLTVFGIAPEDLNKVLARSYGTSYGSMGHYWYSWASVGLSNIVLDEAHLVADTTKSLNFLVALMEFTVRHGDKLILMSATLPRALRETLASASKLYDKIEIIAFEPGSEGYDELFVDERRKKKYHPIEVEGLKSDEKFDKIASWILENREKHSKVIVIFNTVNDALKFYSRIASNRDFEDYSKILLHSRLTEEDRKFKMEKLREIVDKEEYIVVATQTIEAGVDISSTLMISEVAPANSLIQRFGRFLRYGELEGKAYVWYEVDDEGRLKSANAEERKYYKVYDYELTSKTLNYIRNHRDINFHTPEDYSKFLNEVYSKEHFKINYGEVVKMIDIFLSYDKAPEKAVKEFLRLEGSFVREGLLVPAFPSKTLEKSCVEDIVVMSKRVFERKVVPVQHSFLKKHFTGKIVVDEGGELRVRESESLKEAVRDPRSLLKTYFKVRDILAFIVNAKYDRELGLIPLSGSEAV